MSPSSTKNKSNLEKLSKQCADAWWRLSVPQRKSHNQLMQIQLLSPFLFSKVYQDETWVEWAKSAALLSQKRIGAMDELNVEEHRHTDLVELAIIKLQDEIMEHKENKSLEEIIDSLECCKKSESLELALPRVKDRAWFKTVRSQIKSNLSTDEEAERKHDAAVFLAAWQVCVYMKSIFNQSENPLGIYKQDSSLDEYSTMMKNKGNEYFTNSEYSKAINTYTGILYSKPYLYIVYGNRAACYLKKQEFRSALSDGRRATTLNPTYEKGQYRYAQALFELGHSEAALKVLSKATEVCESNETLKDYEKMIKSKIAEETKQPTKVNTKSFDVPLSDNDGGNDDDWDDDLDIGDTGSGYDDMPPLDTESDDSDDDDDDDDDDDCDEEKPEVPELVSDSDSNTDEDNGINETVSISNKKKAEKKESSKASKKATPQHLVSQLMDEEGNHERAEKRAAERKAKEELKAKSAKLSNGKGREKDTNKENETEKEKHKKKKKRKKKDKASVPLDPVELLPTAMKEGSEALLDHRGHTAIHEYKKAVEIIEAQPTLLECKDNMVLQYAYATAYLEAGSHSELVESMRIFNDVIKTYCDLKFPLSYLGIGRIYYKQNRFESVREPLLQALELDAAPDCLSMLSWPGVDTIIEDSRPGNLKVAVEFLLQLCVNPPKPDATCRYTLCPQNRTVLYFSDPDFKGFVRLICTERCLVEFHSACWKKYKLETLDHSLEKDFLKGSCLTPDCMGIVNALQIYENPDGSIKTEYNSTSKVHKQPIIDKSKRMEPSSKTGQGKKLKKLNERLKKKEQQQRIVTEFMQENSNGGLNIIDQIEQHIQDKQEGNTVSSSVSVNNNDSSITEPVVGNTRKSSISMNNNDSSITEPVVDGEMYILKNKGEEDVLFQKGKGKKVKSKKNQKSKVVLDIPYHGSEKNKKNATDVRPEDSDIPFHTPSELKDEVESFEREWQKNNDENIMKPYIIDNSNSINDIDFNEYKKLVPDPVGTATHVFSMFEQILEAKGCADVHNSPDVLEFYSILDDNSKLLITEIGGLRTFLSKCNKFSFDKKNRSVVYLTSQEAFYEMCRDNVVRGSSYTVPQCEEPLFVDTIKRTRSDFINNMNPLAEPFSPSRQNSQSDEENTETVVTEGTPNSKSNDGKINKLDVPVIDKVQSNANTVNKYCDADIITAACRKVETDTKSKKIHSNPLTDTDFADFEFIDDIDATSIANELGGKSTIIIISNKLKSSDGSNKDFELNVPLDETPTKIVVLDEKKPSAKKAEKSSKEKKMSGHAREKKDEKKISHDCDSLCGVIKKRCSECFETVIDDYLCPCTDAKKYDEEKKKKKLCFFNLGMFQISSPPHGRKRVSSESGSSSNNNSKSKQEKSEKDKKSKSEPKVKAEVTKKNNDSTKLTEKCRNDEKERKQEKLDEKKMPICVVNVGIQTDLIKDELAVQKQKNSDLLNVNKALINECNSSRSKYEKLEDDLQKQKVKFNKTQDRLQNELSEYKKAAEKSKKEAIRLLQSHESEIKKMNSEKKELNQFIKNLQKKVDEGLAREREYDALLESKTNELTDMARKMAEIRHAQEQEQLDHEEIVGGLTQSVTEQSMRAEKVEIAFLETKKEVVSTRYQQQAVIIQNTINQMQFMPQVAEYQSIRSIWENYKKHFLSTYELMQEEFISLIEAVRDGQPLEGIPPAKFAEPPPFPQTPMPVNMPSNVHPQIQAQQVQMVMAAQQRNRENMTATTMQNAPLPVTPLPVTLLPISPLPISPLPVTPQVLATEALAVTPIVSNVSSNSNPINIAVPISTVGAAASSSPVTVSTSDSEESETSSTKGDEPKTKMFDRIIMRLGSIFPNYTRDELRNYALDYRYQQPQGSLSGTKIEDLVNNIEWSIRLVNRAAPNAQSDQLNQPPSHSKLIRAAADGSKIKKAPRMQSGVAMEQPITAPPKRTRANHVPASQNSQDAWLEKVSNAQKLNIFGEEEPCVICYEDMTRESGNSKLHCGHVFHRNCITCWFKEQRTCPTCRVHALLPDEYPALA